MFFFLNNCFDVVCLNFFLYEQVNKRKEPNLKLLHYPTTYSIN